MEWKRLSHKSWDLWVGIVAPIIGFAGVSDDVAGWFAWSQISPFYSGMLVGSGATLLAHHFWKTRNRWIEPIRETLGRWMPMRERRLRRLFEAAPSAGKNAAALIRIQRTVEDGEAIVRTLMATPNRTDAVSAITAQLRLRHDLLGDDAGDDAWVEAGFMEGNGEWTHHEWNKAMRETFGDIRGDTVD